MVVVSGQIHNHKIGKFDIARALIHGFGHLFGASHDDISNTACYDDQLYTFMNPFSMHPVQQMNVGPRPNSMRLSPCAKIAMSVFLSSMGSSCLELREESYCGNGSMK